MRFAWAFHWLFIKLHFASHRREKKRDCHRFRSLSKTVEFPKRHRLEDLFLNEAGALMRKVYGG